MRNNVEIIPTDTADTAPPEVGVMEELIEATTKRPDVVQAGLVIAGDDINVRATKNALLPILKTCPATTPRRDWPAFSPIRVMHLRCPLLYAPVLRPGLPTAPTGSSAAPIPMQRAAQLNHSYSQSRRAGEQYHQRADKRSDEANYQIVNNAAIDVHNAQIHWSRRASP